MDNVEFIILVACIIASYGIGYTIGKGQGIWQTITDIKNIIKRGDEYA